MRPAVISYTVKLPTAFRGVSTELASEGVEYVLVGGYAVGYHARPRATKEADLGKQLDGSADEAAR